MYRPFEAWNKGTVPLSHFTHAFSKISGGTSGWEAGQENCPNGGNEEVCHEASPPFLRLEVEKCVEIALEIPVKC